MLRVFKALSFRSGATRGSVCLSAPDRRVWMVPGEPGRPGESAAGRAAAAYRHPFAIATARGRCTCAWPCRLRCCHVLAVRCRGSGRWGRQQPGACAGLRSVPGRVLVSVHKSYVPLSQQLGALALVLGLQPQTQSRLYNSSVCLQLSVRALLGDCASAIAPSGRICPCSGAVLGKAVVLLQTEGSHLPLTLP